MCVKGKEYWRKVDQLKEEAEVDAEEEEDAEGDVSPLTTVLEAPDEPGARREQT